MNAQRDELGEGWQLPDDPFDPSAWAEVGVIDWEMSETDFLDKMSTEEAFNVEHSECTWTPPEPQAVVLSLHDVGPELWWLCATGGLERALLFDSKLLAPPKRPPNPERPMWAINPARTRRNAFGSSRRVK